MSNHNKHTLVPRLRFPEFQNDQWKAEKLGLLGETINGLNGKSAQDFGKGKPFVTYKQVFDSSRVDLTKCALVEIKDNENQNTIQKGDILFTTSSETPNEVGFASVVLTEPEEPTYLNSFCFSFRPFSLERLQPEFSQFLFRSSTFRKSISILAQGITRFNISKSAFLNIKVPLPSKPAEQQKIAACLSSLDDLITAESQKLEWYLQHKKGLLQNLFPQSRLNRDSSDSYDEHDSKSQGNQVNHKNHSPDNVPKLRFPEFVNSGAWVVKRLGEVAEIITGSTPSTNIAEYYDGEVMFVSPADINNSRYVNKTQITLTELGFSKARKIKENSILFVCIGSTIGKVGQNKYVCATNQQINSLNSFENFSNDFLYSLLESNSKRIASLAGNHAVPIINKSLFSSVALPFPSLPEQQKIAACLSSLDDLINAQRQKIELLQQHKKGLLQGLFPDLITN